MGGPNSTLELTVSQGVPLNTVSGYLRCAELLMLHRSTIHNFQSLIRVLAGRGGAICPNRALRQGFLCSDSARLRQPYVILPAKQRQRDSAGVPLLSPMRCFRGIQSAVRKPRKSAFSVIPGRKGVTVVLCCDGTTSSVPKPTTYETNCLSSPDRKIS
jgi:hypothetical protein